MAARFSAINSRNAALHLMERSEGESQESLLDDRRERAHPPDDKVYMENLQPLIPCLSSKKLTCMLRLLLYLLRLIYVSQHPHLSVRL